MSASSRISMNEKKNYQKKNCNIPTTTDADGSFVTEPSTATKIEKEKTSFQTISEHRRPDDLFRIRICLWYSF